MRCVDFAVACLHQLVAVGATLAAVLSSPVSTVSQLPAGEAAVFEPSPVNWDALTTITDTDIMRFSGARESSMKSSDVKQSGYR